MAQHLVDTEERDAVTPAVAAADASIFAPSPEEQRAIISGLEADVVEESLRVYTVSRKWYERWQSYVGLTTTADQSENSNRCVNTRVRSNKETSETTLPSGARASPTESKESGSGSKTPTSGEMVPRCRVNSGDTSKSAPHPVSPGPIEMDLIDDENMSVDEKIWTRWVAWYGVAASHELDRRNWSSDEQDFEICVLSPYCGLVENAIKMFDVAEETGYMELQLRRVFRVPDHRCTRLWVCEKSRHARFQPLLDRAQELCFQDCIDHTKNYILAIEVANLDGTWPTNVPGEPIGSFGRYSHLVGKPVTGWSQGQQVSGVSNNFWETELGTTLETVFAGITAELKETATGIVNTAKCMTSQRENQLKSVREALEMKRNQVEENISTTEREADELAKERASVVADRELLEADRATFSQERQTFAEELVRISTINKIHESRVKLNVGGHVFTTSTLTLTKDCDSMLAAMFSGRHALRQDDEGAYFIDRDGTHFRYILNYLRDGNFRPGTLPSDPTFLSELCTEAEYYQIKSLVDLLTSHLRLINDGDTESAVFPSSVLSPQKTVSGLGLAAGYAGKMASSPASKRLQRKISSQSSK